VTFDKGDIIIKQESFSTNVIYVKTGLVKLHIRGPIKEMIMRIVKAPAYLCLPSTFGAKVNHFSATALEKTTICFIDLHTFKQFIYANGDFAYQILLDLSKAQLESFHNCVNNAQKHSLGKIADVLLFFSNEIYNNPTFVLPITRQDLGDMAGTTRESASRILTDLHNEKIIGLEGKKVTILNQELLKQFSEKG
jgi:CRP/FNR family transcriptional regulator